MGDELAKKYIKESNAFAQIMKEKQKNGTWDVEQKVLDKFSESWCIRNNRLETWEAVGKNSLVLYAFCRAEDKEQFYRMLRRVNMFKSFEARGIIDSLYPPNL
jgi:hypothetical protein